MLDICIIGGGASAMAAAVSAAGQRPELKVCILEKKDAPGRKLAATGNGKCNLTNIVCPQVGETLEFFASLGIITRTDDQGRIYPYSQQAKEVVFGLVRQMEALGVQVRTKCTVEKIEKIEDGFKIICSGETFTARNVLLAAGGKAGPQFGTTGDGYRLAKNFGHRVTRLAPVLTGLEIEAQLKELKGIRVRADAGLYKDERLIAEEAGEIQFTADGISGICIFNLSRFVKFNEGESFSRAISRYQVRLDFLTHMEQQQVMDFLSERCGLPKLLAGDLLLSVIPGAMAVRLMEDAGIDAGIPAYEIAESKLCKLAALLKGWPLQLSGIKGWKDAQCTAGGVELSEINLETMESKLVPGLYFSGEIIDYDGPCGGYNLQNAWETGIKAGRAMMSACKVKEPKKGKCR